MAGGMTEYALLNLSAAPLQIQHSDGIVQQIIINRF